MPALVLSVHRMSQLVGRELSADEVAEVTASLGLSIEEVGENEVKVEYNPNRPDFGSHITLARYFKGMLGTEYGARKYVARGSRVSVKVERSVEDVRPYIACAVVRSLNLLEEDIADLIVLQEDLHWVLGRDRRKVAIGLHDFSKIRQPIVYKAVGHSEISFIPLGAYEEMTPLQILSEHPTGRKYAWILEGKKAVPIILDSRGDVLSFPPIINGSLTELRPGAKSIFIDVTGTDWKAVNQALNIIVTTLLDMGGVAYKTQIKYAGQRKVIYTPDLSPSRWTLDPKWASSLIGSELSAREIIKALRKMRLNAWASKGNIIVEVPPYRVDILHPVDLVEEVAIGVGYQNLEPVYPSTPSVGYLLPSTRILSLIRALMLGLGYTEVVNTTLSNSQRDFKWMGLTTEPKIRILNPISALYDCLREMLTPGLLSNLAANSRNPYPQRLFELGDVLEREDSLPERVKRATHLAFVTCHPNASFSEIKALLEEVLQHLGLDARLEARDYSFFIEGRSAAIMKGDVEIGFLGEVHPRVLENFELYMPVTGCEINLSLAGAV